MQQKQQPNHQTSSHAVIKWYPLGLLSVFQKCFFPLFSRAQIQRFLNFNSNFFFFLFFIFFYYKKNKKKFFFLVKNLFKVNLNENGPCLLIFFCAIFFSPSYHFDQFFFLCFFLIRGLNNRK